MRIDAELAVGDPAPLIAAWTRTHRDEPAIEAAVRWWVQCDRVEEAARLVEETPGLTLWRARFALWRNQPDVARAILAPVIRCGGEICK